MLSSLVPNQGVKSPSHISQPAQGFQVILSFDVEEHFRIEAASGLFLNDGLKAHYSSRVAPPTYWLLEQLESRQIRATFFIVGEFARQNPSLVRDIHGAGHEIASHGWDHRMVSSMSSAAFRCDVAQSKDLLEQLTGQPVLGYRAPTFSITRQTPWAIDVLAELGFAYDASIYPVRHDRYGVPGAPRGPFIAEGRETSLLELPPATLRLFGINAPMGGGGYFRLFPLLFTKWALRQLRSSCKPAVATLYFHPWEFDVDQARLPLGRVSSYRSYVGLSRTRSRLSALLPHYRFARAIDVARKLEDCEGELPSFRLREECSLMETVARS